MPPRFGPASPLPDRALARMMAALLYQWEPPYSHSFTRSGLALLYLRHRDRDVKVLRELVEGDFWKATQETVRQQGAGWLVFDNERLSHARGAFSKEAGIQDFDDWSILERDEVEDAEGRALWDALHAAQRRSWRGDKATIAEHAHKILVYPDLPFQRKQIWERLDSVAAMYYVLKRKEAIKHASTGTASDFEAARFTHLPTYGDIARAAHAERPQASSKELVDYAWGLYRTFSATDTDRRKFGSALRGAIAKHLPQVSVDEVQSRKVQSRLSK